MLANICVLKHYLILIVVGVFVGRDFGVEWLPIAEGASAVSGNGADSNEMETETETAETKRSQQQRGKPICWGGPFTYDVCCRHHNDGSGIASGTGSVGHWGSSVGHPACGAGTSLSYYMCCFPPDSYIQWPTCPQARPKLSTATIRSITSKIKSLYARRSSPLRVHHGLRLPPSFGTTGGGISYDDIELISQLQILIDATNIFVIGNAFGLSVLTLATVFPRSLVDAIDAEAEGNSSHRGTELTRVIVAAQKFNVRVTVGFSPADLRSAMRSRSYDFVLIDGLHTVDQLLADFRGLRPYLSRNAVIFPHDVEAWNLHAAIVAILKEPHMRKYRFLTYLDSPNRLRSGLLVPEELISRFCFLFSEPIWAFAARTNLSSV
eukprot:TRINITY_DN20683_c0_g1_i1.p1 TRINITY_DN20683_c0_g1~~TRINITY_DN20683_c0_g1_i1.p1  ORF type:complete len:379 (+),score=38.01 TRINITY_DN20683_c0_g1_i1:40-1176(+)